MSSDLAYRIKCRIDAAKERGSPDITIGLILADEIVAALDRAENRFHEGVRYGRGEDRDYG